ncbi:biotin-protein ligase [Auriculariales sp. MPI-PUGE-AT-0066]|nr:biotin-protein ligase [Auriculariales sp. MPI-PUGE-AT-0066]
MNVLVYNGPGVSQTSLAHTLGALRALVTPYLSVRTVNASTLAAQPWSSTCALLVLPGGRDLPFVESLSLSQPQSASTASTNQNRTANDAIRAYVSAGGRFLGICAGAYYACARLEWEPGRAGWAVVGSRPLAFFPGLTRGCVYPGFEYASERGARIVRMQLSTSGEEDAEPLHVYYNGGGEFVDGDSLEEEGVMVVARYADDDEGRGKVAAVRCVVGAGTALLWATHPEYPLLSEPVTSVLAKNAAHALNASPYALASAESRRWAFLRSSLVALGIEIPPKSVEEDQKALEIPKAPLPYIFATSDDALRVKVLDALTPYLTDNRTLSDRQSHNVVQIHTPDNSVQLGTLMEDRRINPAMLPEPKPEDQVEKDHEREKVSVDLVLAKLKDIEAGHVPCFNLQRYAEALRTAQGQSTVALNGHRLGDVLFYAEAVESTQTLLDKNSTLASALPAPIVALGTYQLAGRGRGGNAWVSPRGQLAMSLLLRVSLSNLPAPKLAFVQYLFSIAVVEACRALLGAGAAGTVRIKWPNDIYAVTRADGGGVHDPTVTKKLGGILVSTSFRGKEVDLIIGHGLNVLNDHPTTSLASLAADPAAFRASTHIEDVAAQVLTRFDALWAEFVAAGGSFAPFVARYEEYWLHRDQEVTLTTTTPHTRVRIVGLEPKYGLLRTLPTSAAEASSNPFARESAYIDLQPDGNSFDMFAGLIKMKV